MKSAERQQLQLELLAALSQLRQLRPDWRFGQTLTNLAMTAGRLDPGAGWDLEDEEALWAARTLIEQSSDVASMVAEPSGAVGALPKPEDDLLPEYDFDRSKARRNRFAARFPRGSRAVVLDPDVAAVFSTPESVNAVLRALIETMPHQKSR